MRGRLGALLLAMLATTAVAAPPQSSASRLAEDIRILASDEFEGRAAGGAGEEKTVGYLIGRLRQAGLQPGGDVVDGVRRWTQDVPLLRAQMSGPVSVRADGPGESEVMEQGREVAIRPSLRQSGETRLDRAPVVFVGYGVTAPERDWDDYKGVDLRGKIALVLVNDPDFETGEGAFGGKAMTYYGRWTYKYEEAVRRGAAGVLIVHETEPAAYGWAVVRNSHVNPILDVVRASPESAHTSVEGWVQRDVADHWFKAAGLDFATLKQKALGRDFEPVELPGLTLSISFSTTHEKLTSRNVLGLLPGRTRPAESVLYLAHWDHLGVGEPDARGDRIYNGARDNASGVAALLELARAFARGPRPERSVAFFFPTGEEMGLLGSEHYAAVPTLPVETTVASIAVDNSASEGPSRDIKVIGLGASELDDYIAAASAAYGRKVSGDPAPEQGYFYRSDHFSLIKRGVPSMWLRAGDDLVAGGWEAGEAYLRNYLETQYHQPADEWDPKWDLSGIVADIEIYHRLGLDLANTRDWPEWRQGAEFKAARDASRAARRP